MQWYKTFFSNNTLHDHPAVKIMEININVLQCAEITQSQLLFTLYPSYIRGINIDGSHRRNIYTGGRPNAIDFDYRL